MSNRSEPEAAAKPANADKPKAPAAPAAPAPPPPPVVMLKELPPGVVVPADGDYDLLYIEIVMQDPVVDAGRLLGIEGIAGGNSAALNLLLRRLATATGWRAAHDHLHEIHRMAAYEATVVPLWQLREFLAYRKSVEGIGSSPVLLYQNVEQWQSRLQLAIDE